MEHLDLTIKISNIIALVLNIILSTLKVYELFKKSRENDSNKGSRD